MNNQQKGKDLEKRFMGYLSKQGFWVHFLHPAPDGSQPFDIIAIRKIYECTQVCAFDCKTLAGHRFPLDRAEDNQLAAFELLNRKGVHNTYFVVEIEQGSVYYVPSQHVSAMKKDGAKSIDLRGGAYASISIE